MIPALLLAALWGVGLYARHVRLARAQRLERLRASYPPIVMIRSADDRG